MFRMLDASREPLDGHDRRPPSVAHSAIHAARSDRRRTPYPATVTEQSGVPALSAETHVARVAARRGDFAYKSRVFRSSGVPLLSRRYPARVGGDDSRCADRADCEFFGTGVRAPVLARGAFAREASGAPPPSSPRADRPTEAGPGAFVLSCNPASASFVSWLNSAYSTFFPSSNTVCSSPAFLRSRRADGPPPNSTLRWGCFSSASRFCSRDWRRSSRNA